MEKELKDLSVGNYQSTNRTKTGVAKESYELPNTRVLKAQHTVIYNNASPYETEKSKKNVQRSKSIALNQNRREK